MTLIETRIGTNFVAKQSAKGTPAAKPTTPLSGKRLRKLGGGVGSVRTDGREQYVDGQRFPSASRFVDTLIGNGSPVVQGQPDTLAYLMYLLNGQETVTGAADPYTHVGTPNNPGGFWFTYWESIGASVGPLATQHNDCRLVSVNIVGSQQTKTIHVTPTFISLDTGIIYTTDPTVVDSGIDPFLFTEAVGTYTIDGAAYPVQGFDFTVGDATGATYGDDVIPADINFGQGTVTVNNIGLLVNAAGLAWWRTQLYGDATATVGTRPVKTLTGHGSFTFDVTRGASREFKLELLGVDWDVSGAQVDSNPAGGETVLNLTGTAVTTTGNPIYRTTIKTSEAAYA